MRRSDILPSSTCSASPRDYKRSLRTALLLTVAAIVAGAGCAPAKPPPRSPWMEQTRESCLATADLLDGLAAALKRFDASYSKELRRLKGAKGRLTYFSPGLFSRLSKQLTGFDITQPKLKAQLANAAREIHYQYVPRAAWMVAELHRALGLLAQLKVQLQLAASLETRYAEQLIKRRRGAPDPTAQKRPIFGMLIRGNAPVVFTGEMGAPVKRSGGRCVSTTIGEATGYRLSDGNCYFFTAKSPSGGCPRVNGTLRVFHNSDAKLFEAVKCIGIHDVMFDAYVLQLHQLRWILGRLMDLDLARLASTYRRGVPTLKAKPVQVAQSKRACWGVSRVVLDLVGAVQRFEQQLDQQIQKTMRGKKPLRAYNPRLLTTLLAAGKAFDLMQPPLHRRLAQKVWSTPFTHAKGSAPLRSRFHRYLRLLARLTVAVRQARAFEQRTSKLMAPLRPGYRKPAASRTPFWGAVIENDRTARFVARVGEPVSRACVKSTPDKAAGYRLADGTCRYFSVTPRAAGSCRKTHGTFRAFQNTDQELSNRIRCVGREIGAFRQWKHHIVQIKLLLMELNKLNAPALAKRFAKAAE